MVAGALVRRCDALLFDVMHGSWVTLVSQLRRLSHILLPRCRCLYAFHDGIPVVTLGLEVERFLCSVFDRTLCRRHLVSLQTSDHPLQTLVRQNLYLEADEFYALRVGKIAICFVDETVSDSSVQSLKCLFLLQSVFLQ